MLLVADVALVSYWTAAFIALILRIVYACLGVERFAFFIRTPFVAHQFVCKGVIVFEPL